MLKYLLFKTAVLTVAHLPLRVLYPLVVVWADLVYILSPRIRGNVWDNARHVLGPAASKAAIRREAKCSVRSVAKYYADLIRLPYTRPDDFIRRRLTYHGLDEHVRPAIAAGKGVILASCHFGNPELAIQACLARGIEVLALTEPLKPARLSRLVDGLRASQGLTFLPISISSVKKVVRWLREGKVVALMCDRDVEGPRALLPFFDQDAYMPTGPIEVAMRTGATIIPVFSRRLNGDKLEVFLEEPLQLVSTGDFEADVRTNAQQFLERFRQHLSRDPGQWAVLEAIWSRPATEGRAA